MALLCDFRGGDGKVTVRATHCSQGGKRAGRPCKLGHHSGSVVATGRSGRVCRKGVTEGFCTGEQWLRARDLAKNVASSSQTSLLPLLRALF